MVRNRTTALTQDEVCAAALAIIDAEGLEALSMRRLARELGVEAMSLYHHFRNKDAILDAVVASIIREMRLPDPLPSSWVEQLVEMIDAFRAALVAHPNALPALISRPLGPPEHAMATPVSVLLAAGHDPEKLLELYQALMALTFGHAVVASASQGRPDSAPALDGEGFRRAARILIVGFAEGAGAGPVPTAREGSD